MTDSFPKPVSISGDIGGVAALPYLLDPGLPKQAAELALIMTGVVAADSLSAAVIRATIEEHLETVAGGTVTIWPPKLPGAWQTIHALLGPLPDRCALPADTVPPARDRRVYLPTTRVDDMEGAELLARYLRLAGPSAGLTGAESRYLATVLPGLVENALSYAESPCGSIVCGAVDAGSGDAQLNVIDLGDAIAGARAPGRAIRTCIERRESNLGGLAQLGLLALHGGLEVSILLSSGTGRASWSRSHGWRYETVAFAPGFCIGITIHPDRPRRPPRPIATRISASPLDGRAE